ncbi:MAG: histidinol phosphate phosphatase domain-containing protein [Planctomycetes bacterium]|nr:histidinol phosphate phosphatase domain-containing protein [Planctomycetota bacterium]
MLTDAMYDFHTHTLLSDGDFIPAESARRAEVIGYKMLGFSDHSDLATLPDQIPAILRAAEAETRRGAMQVFAGTELTHVRPEQIAEAAALARKLGAQYVVVHGETLAEPVAPGTNMAAIMAGVDILAHPGLITEEEAGVAAEKGVRLEISAKRGHSLANGHVAKMAKLTGATLLFGSDAHTVGDMPKREYAERVCLAAGLTQEEVERMFRGAVAFGEMLAAGR